MTLCRMTEQDLARRVVNWLIAQHHCVYQEVQLARYGAVADIVVDIAGYGWVIETKTSFGLAVIGQAWRWQRSGITRVSIAVPSAKASNAAREMGLVVCKYYGIGIIMVGPNRWGVDREEEIFPPRFVRTPVTQRKRDILSVCCDEHKTACAAGSAKGGYETPYKATINEVRAFLSERNGWVSLKAIIDNVRHHYQAESTARSCLAKWLQTIEVSKGWVECRRNRGCLEFRVSQKVNDNSP